MSLTAATIELLLSKGLTGDDLLEVARSLENNKDRTGAERQARYRERKAGKRNEVTRYVTRDESPPKVSPTPPSNNPPYNPPIVSSNELTPPPENPVEEVEGLKPEHVVEAWNTVAERRGLAKVKQLTPQRRRKLVSRIKEAGVDGFTEAIGTIDASPFLRGENGRGWRADFDWMLEPRNFTKLREGVYGH